MLMRKNSSQSSDTPTASSLAMAMPRPRDFDSMLRTMSSDALAKLARDVNTYREFLTNKRLEAAGGDDLSRLKVSTFGKNTRKNTIYPQVRRLLDPEVSLYTARSETGQNKRIVIPTVAPTTPSAVTTTGAAAASPTASTFL